jgi:hypothetical protein
MQLCTPSHETVGGSPLGHAFEGTRLGTVGSMARDNEPTDVSLAEAQHLISHGAQLVETLPANEFDEEHLPGAISVPLKKLTSDRASKLDPARQVVLYCWNDT